METESRRLEACCREKERLAVTLSTEIGALRRQQKWLPIKNYKLRSTMGSTFIRNLLHPPRPLLVIHNMGVTCSFCTVYADGLNGIFSYLTNFVDPILVSPDFPQILEGFSRSRNWKFPVFSIAGTTLSTDSGFACESNNLLPGLLVVEMAGKELHVTAKYVFEPGDHFSPLWPILSMTGINTSGWEPICGI